MEESKGASNGSNHRSICEMQLNSDEDREKTKKSRCKSKIF
jgi:hypothetical protein